MLNIARVKGERILIGKGAEQIIVQHYGYTIRGKSDIECRLGITAPADYDISTISDGIGNVNGSHVNDRLQGRNLLITRNLSAVIQIGERVSVRIDYAEGKKIGFGIEAPKDILILRDEVVDDFAKLLSSEGKEAEKKALPTVAHKIDDNIVAPEASVISVKKRRKFVVPTKLEP